MNLAEQVQTLTSVLSAATVQRTDGDVVLVAGRAGLVRATRAASCLLVPKVRDTVLLALLDDGSAWILAVLRNNDEADLLLPGKTHVDARSLDIRAESFSVEAETVGLTGRLLSLGGQVLFRSFSAIRTFATSLGERIGKRVSRLGRLEEDVEDLSRRHAGRVQETVDGSYRLRAGDADLKAGGQMDLDAEHIKIG